VTLIAPDRIPEFFRIVVLHLRQIDERRVLLRAIADDLVRIIPGQIH